MVKILRIKYHWFFLNSELCYNMENVGVSLFTCIKLSTQWHDNNSVNNIFFQIFCKSLFRGFIDSLRGVTVLLYLDKEINERAVKQSPNKDNKVFKQKQQ